MAQRTDVQYIQYHTSSAAVGRTIPAISSYLRPLRAKKRKTLRVYVDPVAALGILAATSMLVMMAMGISQLRVEQEKCAVMAEYVDRLEHQNSQLQAEYAASCDLDAVEKTALALGMVPAEQVNHTAVVVEPVEAEEEITLWNRIGTFLTGLFA